MTNLGTNLLGPGMSSDHAAAETAAASRRMTMVLMSDCIKVERLYTTSFEGVIFGQSTCN